MKVGIFDSGIGGLTVLKEAKKQMPFESYIYVADTYHVPYGTKTKEQVHSYVLEVAAFLDAQNIDVLIVACNTATSISVKKLRQIYSFPVIGMEPAVKYALDFKPARRVLVLATPLTLKEEKYDQLLKKYDQKHQVDSLAMPKLVELAEQHIFSGKNVEAYLKEQFKGYDFMVYDSIVLGCTHFTYFRDIIKDMVPSHIEILDGNEGTIRHVKNVMEGKISRDIKGSTIYFRTSKEGIVKADFEV